MIIKVITVQLISGTEYHLTYQNFQKEKWIKCSLEEKTFDTV